MSRPSEEASESLYHEDFPSARPNDVEVEPEGRILFDPIFGKIVVEVKASNLRRTQAGLFIPAPEVSRRTYGVVRAVYAAQEIGGELREPYVQPGDKVLFGEYTGTEVTIGGQDFIIMQEKDLLSIVHFEADEMEDNAVKARSSSPILAGGGGRA